MSKGDELRSPLLFQPPDNTQEKTESNRDTEVRCRYVIDRPAQTQTEFQDTFSGREVDSDPVPLSARAKKCARECNCSLLGRVLLSLFPIVTWLRNYDLRRWLAGDIVSGITVGVVHIPQSMAFSLLAGLPPVFGLYTSFYPVLLYTLMGTSRHISVGTFAVTSLLTQAVVVRFVPDSGDGLALLNETSNTTATTMMPQLDADAQRVAVASALMLLMGVFQLAFGILRLGFITTYLSEPLIQAFTTGAAIQVVTSQTPSILGIKPQTFSGVGSFFLNWIEIFRNLPNTHVPTLVISIVCIILLVIGREINLRYKEKMKIPLPTEVIVVIIAILASHFGMFKDNFGVVVVNNIPTGLPAPQLPNTSILGQIVGDAFAIAIVGFAISVSLSKMYAQKYGYAIDANQELIAYGVTNIVPSFFLCFPNAAALARCVIQENTGGKTQVVGIISVVIVLVTILALGPIFEPLPRSVLGCIIVVGLFGILQQFSNLKPLYKMSKVDFAVWIVTLLAVVVLGVDLGLLAGVVFSMLTVIVRTQHPRCEVMGSVGGTDIYRSCKSCVSATPWPGIVVFKFHSVLYYANKDFFKMNLYQATGVDPDLALAELKREKERLEELEKRMHQPESNSSCFNRRKRSNRSEAIAVDVINDRTPEKKRRGHLRVSCDGKSDDFLHTVVIDCSAFTFIDVVGMKALKALFKSYQGIDVSLLLAHVCRDVRSSLEAGSYFDVAGVGSEFVTVHDAVIYAKYTDSCQSEVKST